MAGGVAKEVFGHLDDDGAVEGQGQCLGGGFERKGDLGAAAELQTGLVEFALERGEVERRAGDGAVLEPAHAAHGGDVGFEAFYLRGQGPAVLGEPLGVYGFGPCGARLEELKLAVKHREGRA